eukprot:4533492-Pyramimonas_sp.AAC.1
MRTRHSLPASVTRIPYGGHACGAWCARCRRRPHTGSRPVERKRSNFWTVSLAVVGTGSTRKTQTK